MDGRPRERAPGHQDSVGDSVSDKLIAYPATWFGKKSISPALLEAHYAEVAARQDVFKLNPDWTKYREYEQAGSLGFIRCDVLPEDKMIGYLVFICEPHLHYKDTIVAIGDVHYVMPEWRRRGAATKLIERAEEVSKNIWHAKFFVLRYKIEHQHGDLYASMGYKAIDVVCLKEL